MTTPEQSYTNRAASAILDAVRDEHDFGGWLAHVLATAAAELGSTAALTPAAPAAGKRTSSSNSRTAPSDGTTTTSPTTPRSLAHEPC